jgi:hypothetical protein
LDRAGLTVDCELDRTSHTEVAQSVRSKGGRYNMVVPRARRCKLFLRQGKGVEDAVDGKDDVLAAVELVCHWRS